LGSGCRFGFFSRESAGDDLGDAVTAHGHAVEDVRGLHCPLLVGDDDELRPLGETAEQGNETSDVRVVERRFHLVEEVEGAGPGEKQREQERDRADRLLAAREQREAGDPLARRPQLDLDAGLGLAVVLGLGEPQPSLAAREERSHDLGEVLLDGGEGLGEASLDRFRELAPEPVELGERALEIGPLVSELLEVLLLPLVLLLRERIDAAQELPTALEPIQLRRQLLARTLGRLRVRLREAAARLGRLRVEPRQLDLDGGRTFSGAGRLAPQLRLVCAQPPKLGGERSRP